MTDAPEQPMDKRCEALLGELRNALISTSRAKGGDFEFSTYTVYPILRYGEVLLLIAPPKAGKSFVALELSWAVATGTAFMGQYQVDEPGPVLYIAGEGAEETLARTEALIRERPRCPLKHPINILPLAVSLRDPTTTYCVSVLAKEVGAKLVIVDTANRCGAGDEGAEHMQGFVHGFTNLRAATGATVVIIHHTPLSDPGRSRGHTSLPAAVDTQWQVKGKDIRTLCVSFGRSGLADKEELAAFKLENVVLGLNRHGREVGVGTLRVMADPPSSMRRPATTKDDLVDRAKELKASGLSVRQIAEAMRASKSAIARLLEE